MTKKSRADASFAINGTNGKIGMSVSLKIFVTYVIIGMDDMVGRSWLYSVKHSSVGDWANGCHVSPIET